MDYRNPNDIRQALSEAIEDEEQGLQKGKFVAVFEGIVALAAMAMYVIRPSITVIIFNIVFIFASAVVYYGCSTPDIWFVLSGLIMVWGSIILLLGWVLAETLLQNDPVKLVIHIPLIVDVLCGIYYVILYRMMKRTKRLRASMAQALQRGPTAPPVAAIRYHGPQVVNIQAAAVPVPSDHDLLNLPIPEESSQATGFSSSDYSASNSYEPSSSVTGGSSSSSSSSSGVGTSESTGDSQDLCIICMSAKKNTIYYPCGHLAACFECAQKTKTKGKCPVCRANIKDVTRMYKT